MPRNILFLTFGVALLSCGCRNNDDQIQTYRIAKESTPSMPAAAAPMMGANAGGSPALPPGHPNIEPGAASSSSDMQSMGAGMGLQPAAGSGEITWKLPSGWVEQPASSMRLGSFLAKGSNGQSVDISVVPLSGDAGGDLANVNRWRGQINLDPISQAELPANSQSITPGGRTMLLVDFVSRDLEVDNKYPKRLVAAIYKQGGRSWFFKMMGEDKAVQEVKPAFMQFLKDLKFQGN
ncbi:MAG TPA: hypothetical protein VMU17_00880 [Elusimicrobiota bacterium]|nr:hypothetical protein [Elusimicrobiota bacterium]